MAEDDAERQERLKQFHDARVRAVLQKRILWRAHVFRARLMWWVIFITIVALLTTVLNAVSVNTAVAFLLGMLATLFVGVLESEPFKVTGQRDDPWFDRQFLFLFILGVIGWAGLLLSHRMDLVSGVASGFLVGAFSVAWIYQLPPEGVE